MKLDNKTVAAGLGLLAAGVATGIAYKKSARFRGVLYEIVQVPGRLMGSFYKSKPDLPPEVNKRNQEIDKFIDKVKERGDLLTGASIGINPRFISCGHGLFKAYSENDINKIMKDDIFKDPTTGEEVHRSNILDENSIKVILRSQPEEGAVITLEDGEGNIEIPPAKYYAHEAKPKEALLFKGQHDIEHSDRCISEIEMKI